MRDENVLLVRMIHNGSSRNHWPQVRRSSGSAIATEVLMNNVGWKGEGSNSDLMLDYKT